MTAPFTLLFVFVAGAVLLAIGLLVRREIRRHREELQRQAVLIKQARPLLEEARCGCGGALTTWDGGLIPWTGPLPPTVAARGLSPDRLLYRVSRTCVGCEREHVFCLWADGDDWGFASET